jgi:hypothetical protein
MSFYMLKKKLGGHMEKQEWKKEWVTPELIVLVRSKPEEAVLTACKYTFYGSSPSLTYDYCEEGDCAACSGWISS